MTFKPIIDALTTLDERYPGLAPIVQLLKTGGPVVWLLAVLSVVALAIALGKLWQQWNMRDRTAIMECLFEHLESGSTEYADALSGRRTGPRAHIVEQATGLLNAGVLTIEELRAEMTRVSREALAPMSTGLRTLEVIATVAPLLGLLGTVLGMIEAFRAMETAGAQVNPAILSGGIWQALLTTAVGLAVAIPVSLLHSWFERRFELKIMRIQNDVQRTIKAFLEIRDKTVSIPAAA